MISIIKFRKVLNDLKRRPEDAAKDLKISKKEIDNILILNFSKVFKIDVKLTQTLS